MAFTLSTIYKAVDRFSPVVRQMQMANASFASKAEYGLGRVNTSLNNMQKITGGVISKLFSLRNAATVVMGAMIAKKIWDSSQAIAKIGDDAANTGRMLGMSAEALQEFQFAAKIQNVSSEALVTSFRFLNKNVGQLMIGTGSLYTNLKKTNPQLANQLKHVKNNEEAFNLITEAIQKLPTQFQKTALAQAAFGRSGTEMLKMTDLGINGINKLREEERKYGAVISNEVAGKMDEYLDTQDRMKMAMQGLKVQLMTGIMPVMQNTVQKIINWIVANKELISSKTKEWADKISLAIKWLARNFTMITKIVKYALFILGGLWAVNTALKVVSASVMILRSAFVAYNFVVGMFYVLQKSVPIALAASSAAMKGYAFAMKAAQIVTWLFSAALWACPITWIVAGVLALVAGVVLLIVYWDKVKAKMDSWSKSAIFQILKFANIFTLVITAIAHFQDRWEAVKNAFKGEGIIAGIKAIGKTILSFIFAPVEAILRALTKIPKIGSKFQGAADWAANIKTGLDEGMVEEKKPVNIQKANNEAQTTRYEEITRQKMELELTNKTDKNINVKSNPALIPVLGVTR